MGRRLGGRREKAEYDGGKRHGMRERCGKRGRSGRKKESRREASSMK